MKKQKEKAKEDVFSLKTKLNRTDLMIGRLEAKVKGLQASLKNSSGHKTLLKVNKEMFF